MTAPAFATALPDGRKVQLQEYGDPSGVPALWFHGGFSSRLEASPLHPHALELGLRVIALDRPGAGGSDPCPGMTLTGYADDVAAVLDELGLEQVAVGGLSNGGMYAMAVAFCLPNRVTRAVPYNPTTPVADGRARAALSMRARLSYRFLARRAERLEDTLLRPPGPALRAFTRLFNRDAHLLEDPEVAAAHAANLAEAGRQAGGGQLRNEIAHSTNPWGFDHRAVPVPVVLVSGEHDAGLPYARRWVEELPNGRLVTVSGGHAGMAAPAVSRRLVELLAQQD